MPDFKRTSAQGYIKKEVESEFLNRWHPEKTQYEESRIRAAIKWIKDLGIEPKGTKTKVEPKRVKEDIPF